MFCKICPRADPGGNTALTCLKPHDPYHSVTLCQAPLPITAWELCTTSFYFCSFINSSLYSIKLHTSVKPDILNIKDQCHICLTWFTLRKSMQVFSLLLPYVSISCSRRVPVVLHDVEVTLHFFTYPCHVLPFLSMCELFLSPHAGSTWCFSSQSIVSVVSLLYPIIFLHAN